MQSSSKKHRIILVQKRFETDEEKNSKQPGQVDDKMNKKNFNESNLSIQPYQDDPEHYFSMASRNRSTMSHYKDKKKYSTFKGQIPYVVGNNFDSQESLPKRQVLGDAELFKQTFIAKTGKDFLGRVVNQNNSPLKIQKSVTGSLGYKSSQNLKNQKKLRYQRVLLTDDELKKCISQIHQRMKIYGDQNENIEEPQLNQSIISLDDYKNAQKMNHGNILTQDQKEMLKNRIKAPYGPMIREKSDQRKLELFEKFQNDWENFQTNSTKYMLSRNYTKDSRQLLTARESLMQKTELFQTQLQERLAMKRALFDQQQFIPRQIWYDSLRDSNVYDKTNINVEPNKEDRTQSQKESRMYFQKLQTNKQLGDLFTRIKTMTDCQNPKISPENVEIFVKPNLRNYSLQRANTTQNMKRITNIQPNTTIIKDCFVQKLKERNRENYQAQMMGCRNLEDLKMVKVIYLLTLIHLLQIEGQSQLSREIEACYKTDGMNRFFCVNANKLDEETGEREPDITQEIIVEHYDKKAKY
ncbi:UNKNOWN [Stylonychia lemnae]|uniref:Uncharacterized protein n=1 Tax=Stylonychia lemnae TaxID=5949 RepID=A0A078ANG0_STYLE|nr:UNKNOWN [Stylonychia lemnae]|eukprot:CDW83451.1 UNKNOWN [Stylonychia lemnae]